MKRLIRLFMASLLLILWPVFCISCSHTNQNNNNEETSKMDTNTSTKPVEQKDPNLLYNGIRLPDIWPPRNISSKWGDEIAIPYLSNISEGGTHPEVVDIDVGRQLFVDDFLIESTTLNTRFHKAVKYEQNPVLKAETEIEGHSVALTDGGVWYDEEKKIFQMWYQSNWMNRVCYAYSYDGINWIRPSLFIEGNTNIVVNGIRPDSTTVFVNKDATNPNEKYWMFIRVPKSVGNYALIFTSSNGINWTLRAKTSEIEDRSTMFYNPFRQVWVYSIRSRKALVNTGSINPRVRLYAEALNPISIASELHYRSVLWLKTDKYDMTSEYTDMPQLYNFNAVAYESIMLGIFEIWLGPENREIEATGMPKITELILAYSRDGFHFSRPDRQAFISASRTQGTWDMGYLSPSGGICLIVGDELWFYYTGFAGTGTVGGHYKNASIGLAKLRRDGFVSLNGTGEVTTNPLTFQEDKKYLFVNAAATSLKAEIIDENGNVVEGFSMDECIAFSGDSTCAKITWKNSDDLSFLKNKNFKIRFALQDGDFYAFWLSGSENGESGGYYAAGLVDTKVN